MFLLHLELFYLNLDKMFFLIKLAIIKILSLMKNFLPFVLILLFVFSFVRLEASENENNSKVDNCSLSSMYLDPGHNQKRGKDASVIEMYYGMTPSAFALKYNLSFKTPKTESVYVMTGMDFDSDMFAKIGIVLNPGKKNKNLPTFPNPDGKISFLFKGWRYVMVRQALELGYKGHFLDTEETETIPYQTPGSGNNFIGDSNDNYGGLTCNYSLILDGNFLFDKAMWKIFDHRTARRIRLKFDVGAFFNLNKFNQPNTGFVNIIGNNNAIESDGDLVLDINEDELNNYGSEETNSFFGQPLLMPTYSVVQLFLNFSIGFAF